jgi:integrase
LHGWREGPNPARWRGHLDKLFPKRGKVRPVRHHPALPWQDIGAFMAALHRHKGISARALEFLILTATRTGEVLGARWGEVDLDAGVWTVPGERMKGGKEHRVALAPAAVALLRGLLPERAAPDRLVFPGRREGRPLSVMALEMVMRRMNAHPEGEAPRWRDHRGDAAVPHGFRSTFRDWAGETTAHPREVVEAALSHRLGDKVEQAYARGDLFAKRRRLMEEWAAFCAKPPAEVVALRPAASDPDADSAKSADREAAGREPDAPPVLPLDVLHHHDVADGLLTGRTICSGGWIPRRHRDTLGDLG